MCIVVSFKLYKYMAYSFHSHLEDIEGFRAGIQIPIKVSRAVSGENNVPFAQHTDSVDESTERCAMSTVLESIG